MNILIIGESCKDVFHYGESVRLCPDAPVPVFKSIKIVENGGMAKNVENNIRSLGAETFLMTNSNHQDITKTRLVDYRTNHMFLRVDQNDLDYQKLNKKDVLNVEFTKYDAVIVSDYNKGFLSDNVLKTISLCHDITFIDTKRPLGPWANNFSFIKLNSLEYEKTKSTITKKMREKLIITRGHLGSEHQGTVYEVPAVEVRDTSGAGDTFVSALCHEYVITKKISLAIRFANNCATKVVQKQGVSVI